MALFLVFLLTPFASEMGEWAVHYLVHGDFAHASGHRSATTEDEHGCTPLMHICACHAGACTATSQRRIEQVVQDLSSVSLAPVENTGRAQDPPPHRPPLA